MGKATEGNDHAVSELIGAILLVALVITAMAIVAVLILSNPPPEEVPQLNVLASRNEASMQFFIYHNGGDELRAEQTIIHVNNNPIQVSNDSITLQFENGTRINWAGSNIPLSVGKTLIINSSPTAPKSITVTFKGSTSHYLLLSTTFPNGT